MRAENGRKATIEASSVRPEAPSSGLCGGGFARAPAGAATASLIAGALKGYFTVQTVRAAGRKRRRVGRLPAGAILESDGPRCDQVDPERNFAEDAASLAAIELRRVNGAGRAR